MKNGYGQNTLYTCINLQRINKKYIKIAVFE